MIAYIQHRKTVDATGIATWDVTIPELHWRISIKGEAGTSNQDLKREAHRILSPLVDGPFTVQFYKPVIIPSSTPTKTPASLIQARIDETQIEINTLDRANRSQVRHLQDKLKGLKTPLDVTHELILEVMAVGAGLEDALSERYQLVKKIELMREFRNEELAAKP